MKKGRLFQEEGIKISENKLLQEAKNRLSKQNIKTVEKELAQPHLIYDDIALTNNRIVALNSNSSPNGAFTNIEYSKIAWIYIGETGGTSIFNLERILSIATNDINGAQKNARHSALSEYTMNLFHSLLVGFPRSDYHTVIVIFSGNKEAIVAFDQKGRLNPGAQSGLTGKIKCGKNFQELIDTITEKCPDIAIGAEYEDEYRALVGEELIIKSTIPTEDDEDEEEF